MATGDWKDDANDFAFYAHYFLGIFFGYVVMLFREEPDIEEVFARVMTGSIFFMLGIANMVQTLVKYRDDWTAYSRRKMLTLSIIDLGLILSLVALAQMILGDLPIRAFCGFYFAGLALLCHLLYVNLRCHLFNGR